MSIISDDDEVSRRTFELCYTATAIELQFCSPPSSQVRLPRKLESSKL